MNIKDKRFENKVKNIIKESIAALADDVITSDNLNEEEREDKKESKSNTVSNNNLVKRQVEKFFKQPGVNTAQYAYKLYGVKPVKGQDSNDMKNARSKFMKCLYHEKNDEGSVYAFDGPEIVSLHSMISGGELNENKNNIIKIDESSLCNIVKESVKRILKESYAKDGNYTHFAVNKETNKIVNGWDNSRK